MSDIAKVVALLNQAVALLVTGPSAPQLSYPALVNHAGVTYLLKAPLAADYEPSMYAKIFGGSPGTNVLDPSNAPEGFALRSPAGYPLYYSIAYGGKLVGQPRVSWGENTFANDAEVADYRARLAASGTAGGVFSPGPNPPKQPPGRADRMAERDRAGDDVEPPVTDVPIEN